MYNHLNYWLRAFKRQYLITDYVPPNYIKTKPVHLTKYFTLQLVQVSLFANILPLQNFPMYGIHQYFCNGVSIKQQIYIIFNHIYCMHVRIYCT